MGATKRAEGRASKTSSRSLVGPTRLDHTASRDSSFGTAEPATFTAKLVALDERGLAWLMPDDEVDEVDELVEGGHASPERARQRPQPARSTVPLRPEHVGRTVLACRANRDGQRVIVGVLIDAPSEVSAPPPAIDLVFEGRRIVLSAQTEVVLRCGEGSITLAADGKVTIRGVDVVSSASRTQRIRGGAVRIN